MAQESEWAVCWLVVGASFPPASHPFAVYADYEERVLGLLGYDGESCNKISILSTIIE
jgi:hypothetical protein